MIRSTHHHHRRRLTRVGFGRSDIQEQPMTQVANDPTSTAAPVDADALVARVQQLLQSSQKLRQAIVDEHTAETNQATASAALDAAAGVTKTAQGMVLESVADVQASELAVLSILQPPPPATAPVGG